MRLALHMEHCGVMQCFNNGVQGSIADVRVGVVVGRVSSCLYVVVAGAFEGLELASRLVLHLFAILEEEFLQMRVNHLVESILSIILVVRGSPQTYRTLIPTSYKMSLNSEDHGPQILGEGTQTQMICSGSCDPNDPDLGGYLHLVG